MGLQFATDLSKAAADGQGRCVSRQQWMTEAPRSGWGFEMHTHHRQTPLKTADVCNTRDKL